MKSEKQNCKLSFEMQELRECLLSDARSHCHIANGQQLCMVLLNAGVIQGHITVISEFYNILF